MLLSSIYRELLCVFCCHSVKLIVIDVRGLPCWDFEPFANPLSISGIIRIFLFVMSPIFVLTYSIVNVSAFD